MNATLVTRLRAALTEAAAVLERINEVACYASEEDTNAQAEALLMIGKLARGEVKP